MVRIIGDTTSGLSAEKAKKYNIPIIPQIININGHSYLEELEIDYATFLQKLRVAKELPKTAAPPPELFVEAFEEMLPTGEPILCVMPSATVSGTVRSAQLALQTIIEQGYEDPDVRIIDTHVVASPVAVMLELAGQWAQQGVDADTIEARIKEMSTRCKIYFLVDTLKYLAMGGRIGGAAALLGSILQVKPVLSFEDGQVNAFEKVRTHKRGIARLKELVHAEIARDGKGHLTVLHAAAEDEAQKMAEELGDELDITEVPVYAVPPAVVTHGGPGILGVGFFTA